MKCQQTIENIMNNILGSKFIIVLLFMLILKFCGKCINIPDALHIANANKYTVFDYLIATQYTFYSEKNEVNYHNSDD